MTTLDSDAGRDQVQVDIRLDKIVLCVREARGGEARTELTPAEARRLVGILRDAAADAERTPGS